MRILLVADLHYALRQFDWVAEVAGDFDLVVLAGDLLDAFSIVDGRAQIVVVTKYLEKVAAMTRLVVCSGNHDLDATDEAGEKAALWMRDLRDLSIATDGDRFEIGDTLVSVCPWWDGPAAREAIGEQLARDAAHRRGPWIWVYHAPPADSPVSWGGARHFGDVELSRWIGQYRPDVVLSGHVHQSPFVPSGSWIDRIGTTFVFNGGNQVGPAPTHIIIDCDAREAAWFSLAGNQIAGLEGERARPVPLKGVPVWLRAVGPSPAPNPA